MPLFMSLFFLSPVIQDISMVYYIITCSLLFQQQNKVHITYVWNKVELMSKILYMYTLSFHHFFFFSRLHKFDAPCFCTMHIFAYFLGEWKFYFARDSMEVNGLECAKMIFFYCWIGMKRVWYWENASINETWWIRKGITQNLYYSYEYLFWKMTDWAQ